MTGTKEQDELDVYFKSKRFRKRLDDIRKTTSNPSELKVLAFQVTNKLGMKTDHTTVISNYLLTGKYIPRYNSSIQLIDQSSTPIDPIADRIGVAIELNEDTIKKELHDFIDANWQDIKGLLDRNYPGRKKRFEEIRRIDDYLAIADKLNAMPDGSQKARKAEELAVDYNLPGTAEVYDIAAKYKSILED